MKPLSQGRIKIMQSSPAYLEMIHSWAKSDELLKDDPFLYINLTIVWFQVDQNKTKPMLWNEEALTSITQNWLEIPANFMVDEEVRAQTFRMLASLLNLFWTRNMNIHLIRSFHKTLKKAAADIESYCIAGFLKYAVVKPTTRPKLIDFNGSIRKVADAHFACTIIIVRRSKASCEDIENFFTVKNANGGLSHYFMKENKEKETEMSVDANEVRLILD